MIEFCVVVFFCLNWILKAGIFRYAKRSALSGDRMSSGVLQKLNHNHWDVRIAVSNVSDCGERQQKDEDVLERRKKDRSRFFKPETKRALFDKNPL